MWKDNIVTIILIVLIILVIVGGSMYLIICFRNANQNETTISEISNSHTTFHQEENEKRSNEANGSAMELTIKETKEQSINNGTSKVDIVSIDDFVITIPSQLKEEGYKINLTNQNKVLDITSSDNSYHCEIARFSSVNPYELTEQQDNELTELYDEIASQACNQLGVLEEDDNYYDVYYEEYAKATSNSKIINFYDKYRINRHTRFAGFSNEELDEAWNVFHTNRNELKWNSNNESGGMKKTIYKSDNMTGYEYEIDGNQNTFAGLFLQIETFTGNPSALSNYEVRFRAF